MDVFFGTMFKSDAETLSQNAVLQNVELIKEQLEQYKEVAIGINKDPLVWWKENKSTFSPLGAAARNRLCIAGTSVPSEKLFSAAVNLMIAK